MGKVLESQERRVWNLRQVDVEGRSAWLNSKRGSKNDKAAIWDCKVIFDIDDANTSAELRSFDEVSSKLYNNNKLFIYVFIRYCVICYIT